VISVWSFKPRCDTEMDGDVDVVSSKFHVLALQIVLLGTLNIVNRYEADIIATTGWRRINPF